MPTITIVTPSFNQARYLKRTLESVLSQEVDLEYIVIDGGSTDGSVEILRSYESRIRLVVEKDDGQADAISKGFAMASGDILAWLNSDDMYLPGALKKVVDAFKGGEEFIYGHALIVDATDRVLRKRVVIPVDFNDLYYGPYTLTQEATFFSRRLYRRSGGLDTSFNYAMDYDLWLRMARLKAPKRIDEYLSCFRYHEEQKSRKLDRYIEEVNRARSRMESSIPHSRAKSSIRGVSLGLRKLAANIRESGFTTTIGDTVKKQLGLLPR